MEPYMPSVEQAERAKRNQKMELAPGEHPNTFSEQRNLFIAEGTATLEIPGQPEEVLQQGYIYMFKAGETVKFHVKEKLVVYFA